MSQELITREQAAAPFGPNKGMSTGINVGSVSIETERAIAEARGSIQVAQMFPRDVAAARAELMNECDYLEFAQVAFYSVPRAGGAVTGPSIRLAEAVASAYGHMEWGHVELSRSDDKSEVEVYCWDKQKNNRRKRQVTVDHYRDTKNGRVKLRDEKDIQDKIANVAAKQMRGCILAILPKSLTEATMARCRATLAGGGGVPLVERVNKMTDAFAKMGVTAALLAEYLGHPLGQTNGDEIVDLTAIYQAIKGGDKIADYFGKKDDDASASEQVESLAASAKAGAATQAKPAAAKPAAKPAVKAEAKAEPAAKAEEPAATAESAASNPAKEEGNQAQPESNQAEEQGQAASDNQQTDAPGVELF